MPFEPELTIRNPLPRDRDIAFEAGGQLRGRTAFDGLLEHHSPSRGQYTLVADHLGTVLGVATLTVHGQSLHLDFLARGGSADPASRIRVGRPLFEACCALAVTLGPKTITLEAVDDPRTLSFYEEVGCTTDGPPSDDADWGKLHPMKKDVARP
jgi:hypothetical protein